MRKTILLFLFLCFIPSIYAQNSKPTIILMPGTNELSIKIQNNSSLDLKTVQLSMDESILPEGIQITRLPAGTDIPAKSENPEVIVLQIEVTDVARTGEYNIPFSLRDKQDNTWDYEILAKVEVPLPEKFELFQNYPNPFTKGTKRNANATTQLKYSILSEKEQRTQLIIYDVLGRQVKKLVDKKQPSGFYKVEWDGKNEHGVPVPSGIYFYRLVSGSFVNIKKMIIVE